jgi:hypothetical protein
MIRTTWPQLHPHGHLKPVEQLNAMADKGSQLGPHPSALHAVIAGRHHSGVVDCEGSSRAHRISTLAEGQGGYL